MPEQNLAVLTRLYDAFNRRDARNADCMDPAWRYPHPTTVWSMRR